jgi:hypothetical protein
MLDVSHEIFGFVTNMVDCGPSVNVSAAETLMTINQVLKCTC